MVNKCALRSLRRRSADCVVLDHCSIASALICAAVVAEPVDCLSSEQSCAYFAIPALWFLDTVAAEGFPRGA